MIKNYEANPLNIHALREVSFCPPHFTKVDMSGSYVPPNTLKKWLYANLEGRFHIGTGERDHIVKFIAFEIQGEASYFALMKDTIYSFYDNF